MTKHAVKILVIIITILLVIGAVALRKNRMAEVENLPPVTQSPWALYVSPVHSGTITKGFPVLARLYGSTEITVASQISGLIESTGPREGVTVKKGTILANILVEDLIEERFGIEQQRKIALSEKKRKKDELIRQQKLIKAKLTTQELFDAKKAASIAADKQVLTIDRQLSAIDVRIGYGIVRAPEDAIIAAKLAETGDVAQPGKALYKLTVNSGARINVHLPQQVLEKTSVNSKVILMHGSKTQTIFLTRIFPALDAQNIGSAEADLASMPFSLRSGARITARVVIREIENALIVPHRALVVNSDGDGDADKGFVFKIIDDNGVKKLARVDVKILLHGHEGIAVSGDLSEADEVVNAHQSVLIQLKDNDLVSPSEIDQNDF